MAPVKYIFVNSQKEKAIELKEKLDAFKDKFDRDLLMEIQIVQTKATEKKELENLVRALGENRLPLGKPCMEGTRTAILQEIEDNIKNVNGPNMIWIGGYPGVGKSALAASIANRLEDQKQQVISFRFDRTKKTITTKALWCAVACDLARLYSSLRPHLARGIQGHSSSDIDRLFKSLIEEPLSLLDDDVTRKELPVIVIDALDECGGLRHDASEMDDFEGLMRTLQRWVQVDHLKKFKLVITSRPEDFITLPDPISIHEIPSGHRVKPDDSISNDIRIFLKSRLDDMKMEPAWIAKALDFLVRGAAGIFIWATTVANFLKRDPERRFAMLEKDDRTELDGLHSLYSTIIKASFGPDLREEETRVVVSVIGAMVFSKEPLDDNALIMLPEVKILGSDVNNLGLIRKGLMSVIDPGPILRFHHRSFEDFLLSLSFRQQHPELVDIQDRVYHEHQLTVLCLKTLVSPKLHFNMCSLESSIIKNIQVTAKTIIPPLVSYSCQYWADHLVNTTSDKTLMEAVKFVMDEKLLFWLEAMSLLGKTYEATLILRMALGWKVCLQFIFRNKSLMLAVQTLNPDHELTLFVRDALRFISAFIVPISQSAPHIYVSSLSFAPKQSLVAKKFCSRFPNTIVVTEGRPSQWPMVIFTAEHHKNSAYHVVFSPDESVFAIFAFKPDYITNDTTNDTTNDAFKTTIRICDSDTGHCISVLFELPYLGIIDSVCLSPDGKHILLKSRFYAAILDTVTGKEKFRIKGWDVVLIRHSKRIASTHWINEDGKVIQRIAWGDSEDEGGDPTGIVVKLQDASSGALISDRLFEVNDVAHTLFSPDGHFLAITRRFENVIELWNLEDEKDSPRFLYPSGNSLKLLCFSPNSDSLMAASRGNIYVWRLDTQEEAFFNHDFYYDPHVVHSPLTNYVFIARCYTVEIWDVSMTGSKLIWKTNPPTTSLISSTCPSRDGHRLLVGCSDGSVRMWELDLENLTMNQADTIDTQADTDMPQVAAFSPSGKIVATRSELSHIKFLDTDSGEVVARTDFDDEVEIAFSPDEDEVAFLSYSLITICNTVHRKNSISFDPWPRTFVPIRKVAFQTCNDLVICGLDLFSVSLQVWRRQDPARFECTYSSDWKPEPFSYPCLAPDGLTVLIVSRCSTTCYLWDHDAVEFHSVDFDDQVHIRRDTLPVYSPDGKLFACFSRNDSHVRVWDTRTGRLVFKFPTSEVDAMALSPTRTGHSRGDGLIALWSKSKNTIYLHDVSTGYLYAKILGRGSANMAFIQDGKKLAQYSSDFGLRTLDVPDEHWHSIHGYEPILKDMTDGWVVGRDNEPLFWVPVEHRVNLDMPSPRVVLGIPEEMATWVDISNSRLCGKWTECIDKEWVREVEQKEKEVRNLLEKYVLSSAQVLEDVQMDRWTGT